MGQKNGANKDSEMAPGATCSQGVWHYPLDNSLSTGYGTIYPLNSDLSCGQHYPPFEQLGPEGDGEDNYVSFTCIFARKSN